MLKAQEAAATLTAKTLMSRMDKIDEVSKLQFASALHCVPPEAATLDDNSTFNFAGALSTFLDCVDAHCPHLPTAMMAHGYFPNIQATQLRVVDPLADDHVWAIIGDARNCFCHGGGWRKNAEAKLDTLGFQVCSLNRSPTAFKGLGYKTISGNFQWA